MAILSGKRLGPYEVLSAIGAGGMGEVYRAIDDRLNWIRRKMRERISLVAAGLVLLALLAFSFRNANAQQNPQGTGVTAAQGGQAGAPGRGKLELRSQPYMDRLMCRSYRPGSS
ncbi:MAG: hypothetical protein DMG30_16940 [Acidobacteria bacterium]|nr:MAG: hypothetical protein DMG30_16940 [Acidobacteriota bacterium]